MATSPGDHRSARSLRPLALTRCLIREAAVTSRPTESALAAMILLVAARGQPRRRDRAATVVQTGLFSENARSGETLDAAFAKARLPSAALSNVLRFPLGR